MIDEGLLKNNNIGKDGFIWWLGQVCEAETWRDNYPPLPVDLLSDLPGFKRRVKVSILGWHTDSKNDLKNDDLPWAYCLMPTSAGGGTGGFSESLAFTGGEWVFGFFLDGEDGQQPVIIGVMDKSTQNDWRDSVPETSRFEPFSGFSNKRVAPLSDLKKDGTVERQPVGDATTEVGNTGVKRTQTVPTEVVRLERGAAEDVRAKASKSRHDNLQATGDMTAADNSDDRNPFAGTDKVMKRLSKIETFVKAHDGIKVDGSTNKLFDKTMEREQKRASRIIATDQKDRTEKMRAATLEATSKMMSNVATFGKLSEMAKVKEEYADAIGGVIGSFNGMVDKLPGNAAGFIKDAANKIVSQPPCVAESYTGALVGKTIAELDGTMNKMMGPVNSVLSAASGGDFPPDMGGTIGGLMTKGLNAFGGISINLDGIANFSTSYKKLMEGEKPIPATKIKDISALAGSLAEIPSQVKDGNILENIAAAIPASGALVKGGSSFLNNNSIFNTAINSDNLNLSKLGGIGGITDTLNLAKNLPGIQSMPGTTGESVLNVAKSFLEQGDTLDAAALAADIVFPGGGALVKLAFDKQIGGQRLAGGSCETGPSQNGPPKITIFGGNGNGATANPVIGSDGEILSVELTRGGKGFSEIPYCVVDDTSGKGKGGVVKADLDWDNPDKTNTPWTYAIKDIDVLEPGSNYLGAPDGSVGGSGRTYAEGNSTIIKDKEGNFYPFEPGTGISVPPGGVVYLPTGTKCMLPTSAITTDGKSIVPPAGSNIVDYAALRLMHNFDHRGGKKIIPGPQGADTGVVDNGFGAGDDLRNAKAAGFSNADIRYYLEGDPDRGQSSAFLVHKQGKIGRNMQKLLDDPSWGQLPVMNSGGKKPGKIKSIQINLRKGYKGFAKVTDGSRLGAGPILSLRDAVTDRKVSNILEFQTGNWMNINPEIGGNTEILNLFKEAELRSINGTPIEDHGKFGTAGLQTWEQTKIGAEGFVANEKVKGGGQRKNVLGQNYRTLDPWRADLADGTRLKFRGAYNHNSGMTVEQQADPYNIQKNNYRYFVYDYEVEVYSTPQGYGYSQGIDTTKTKWYRLIDLKFVTGSEDWFNGEVVKKRCNDKAGRLYEMYITICTYDDDKAEVIGQGLSTNIEQQEIIKTALPCNPETQRDDNADYQKCRWFRKKNGVETYSEQWGHIIGSERNTLIREIVKVYNEVGDKNKVRKTDYHNETPYKEARKYVDKGGMEHWVQNYLNQLKRYRKGLSCESEEYIVPGVKGQSSVPITYNGLKAPGDKRFSNSKRLEFDDDSAGGFDINASLTIMSTTGGVSVKFNNNGTALEVKGTGTVTLKYDWNDNPNTSGKSLESLTIGGTTWTQSDNKRGNETHTISVNSVSKPDTKKTRTKKVIPLSEEDYVSYSNNLNQKPHSGAFACMKKDIWKGFIEAARKGGPIVNEQTYCDWATEYVEEVRSSFRAATNIGYILPCGGEITAPSETPKKPPSGGEPKILVGKAVKITTCGTGYTGGDQISIGGETVPFTLTPTGGIITCGPPPYGPFIKYPEVDITTKYGAGADIELTLKVEEPTDAELSPLKMVEVIDCVGKNIFIKES